jgi:glycosyltransferase involved in cell wall biosynthesis
MEQKMKTNPKISIIIPVYNVEKYIQECIDSVLSQTFTDFECIIINDGSTDNSGNICDEYAEKDKRIKIIHKKNGGVSSARNAGLDIAKGEWIVFVDGDDWVDEKYLEFLYGNAVTCNVDVSICGVNVFEDGLIYHSDKSVSSVTLTPKEAILIMFDIKASFSGFSVNKLFKKQLLDKNSLKYDESVSYMEDVRFFYELFKMAGKIYYSSQPYYFYRQINTSVTRQAGFTTAVDTAIAVLDDLYAREQDFEIQQKIFLNKIYFIYRKGIKCILQNKKEGTYRTNMHILKQYIFGRNTLPIVLRCKIFVLIYLSFVICPYINVKNKCKGKIR